MTQTGVKEEDTVGVLGTAAMSATAPKDGHPREGRPMQLFVGNLAFTTTEAELRQLFGPCGEVQRVQILTDRETGRSRGFGFVEMPNTTEARAASKGLDSTTLGGRQLTVNEARPREGRRDGPRRERW